MITINSSYNDSKKQFSLADEAGSPTIYQASYS